MRLLRLRLRKLVRASSSRALLRAMLGRRIAPSVEHDALDVSRFRTLIDVGANRGQFALWSLDRSDSLRVLAFEPGRSAYEDLTWALRPFSGRVDTQRIAIGEYDGIAVLNVTKGSDNSSLLTPSPKQLRLASESEVVSREDVSVARLDSAMAGRALQSPILLKIDVQGTENLVLRGAGEVLQTVDAVYVELTFDELYIAGRSGSEVVNRLVRAGFELQGLYNPTSVGSAVVQCDALFGRSTSWDQ